MLVRSFIYSLFLIIAAQLTGCADSTSIVRSKTPPDWAVGDSSKYPESLYIRATGSASSAETAKDRAMANLAKIFELHIEENSTTSIETQSVTSANQETTSNQQRLAQRINIRTDKVLEGIRIAELWQNVSDLTYFALAIIDRKFVGKLLENEIQRYDDDSAYLLNGIGTQKDNLKRIASYQRVIQLQDERSELQKTLKIIDLRGEGMPSRWSLVELKAIAASVLTEISMSAYVHSDQPQSLKQQLEAAMSSAGFPAVSGRSDYTLLIELDSDDVENNEGWYWQRGVLSIRLINASTGVTRGSHSWPLKASSTRESQLHSRFNLEIENTLKNDLKAALIEMAE